MSFFGVDWRAPGDRWIRTELGWKRLCDVHTSLRLQLTLKVAASQSPSKRTGTRSRSLSSSPRNSTRTSSRSSSRIGSPLREKSERYSDEYKCIRHLILNMTLPECGDWYYYYLGIFRKSFDERRFRLLQFALAQRCISARMSSRESSHYATVSDALNKLNFSQALMDANCFPFICKVVGILFEQRYWTLSGSMQTSLLRLTDAATDIAIESRQHTGLTLRLIDKEKETLEKGRSKMMTGFSISRLDSKIKALLTSRAQLTGELHREDGKTPPSLPGDCWRLIIAYLTNPRDVLNLGCVNDKLYSITSEDWVWRDLTKYHYGKAPVATDSQPDNYMNIFKQTYISSGKQLKSLESHAVALCQLCHSVYWRSYGHPCLSSTSGSKTQAAGTTDLETRQPSNTRLTAHQFVQLFNC